LRDEELITEMASDEDTACIKNISYCSDLNKFISKQFIGEFLIPLVKIKKLFYKKTLLNFLFLV
jgi:hypothetical protein